MSIAYYTNGINPKFSGSSGNIHSRKNRKRKNPHSERGRIKVVTCQATAFERTMAKRSRSFKHRDYESWRLKLKAGMSRGS